MNCKALNRRVEDWTEFNEYGQVLRWNNFHWNREKSLPTLKYFSSKYRCADLHSLIDRGVFDVFNTKRQYFNFFFYLFIMNE